MIPTLATRPPLPALAVEAPTTVILIELGNGFLFRSNVAHMLWEIQNALDDLEPADLERIAHLARVARERQNDCSELPLFAKMEG